MFLYVILIVILVSFVIAFFSAKTWHWGYVVLVEGILLATFGYLLLAAETVRINRALQTEAVRLEKQLVDLKADNEGLEKGTSDVNVLGRARGAEPALV